MEIMKAVASHIKIDDQGVPWIAGGNTKVIEVVLDKLAYGWSPEEMHLQTEWCLRSTQPNIT